MKNIDQLCNAIQSANVDKVVKDLIDTRYTEEQLTQIINSLIKGRIDKYIIEQLTRVTADKLGASIEIAFDDAMRESTLQERLKYECKKYIYEKDFWKHIKVYFQEKLLGYMGQYVESYYLHQLAEKFLTDIKQAHEESLEMN
jgi:predicted RNA methylase